MEEGDLADGWFPESVAADYDAPGGANAPEVVVPMVDVLEDLAGSGPVLEFAVGTGRIAAPLAARGLAVTPSGSESLWKINRRPTTGSLWSA